MIGDFGCARFASAGTSGSFFAATYEEVCGSVRWLCPEILMPTLGESEEAMHIYSTASDVWAFGMTALEVTSQIRVYTC
jgi:serine/threonine protein kinase